MIIEFVGVSGVGKTTFVEKYCYESNNSHVIVVDKKIDSYKNWILRNTYRFIKCVPFIINNFNWIGRLKLILWSLDLRLKDKIVLLYHGIYLKRQILSCLDSNKNYIIDEGTIHYIWSVFMRLNQAINKDLLLRIGEEISFPDQVYYIDAQTDVILDRLIKRGRKTRILENSNLKDEIQQNRQRLNDIIQIICKNNILDKDFVIYIDNSLPFKG